MKNNINIGIDLGRTIIQSSVNGCPPFDLCFETIKEMLYIYNDIYIVSRVNSEQKDRAEEWLYNNDFFKRTNFNPNNLYFCFDRRDKAIFVKGLNISIFIDDRPEVLSYMDKNVRKIIFNPYSKDLEKYKDKISSMEICLDWQQVAQNLNINI